MVVNELECDLFRAGYIQTPTRSDVLDDERNPHEQETNWHLLFPEVIQAANHSSDLQVINDRQADNHHAHRRSASHQNSGPNKSSAEISDESLSLAIIERVRGHDKQQFSDSSSEDLIVIDHSITEPYWAEDANIRTHIPMPVSLANFAEEEELEPSVITNSWLSSYEPALVNPPAQRMHKDEGGYDPQRIPSSVFERCDSLIPAEWSATSNESLFSLHLGDASIARDQALLLSGELKTHEGLFPKLKADFVIQDLQEMSELAGLSKSCDDDHHNVSTSTPNMYEVTSQGGVGHDQKRPKDKLVTTVNMVEEGKNTTSMEKLEEAKTPKGLNIHSSSISFHSNTSEDSSYSFAFPIFGEVGRNSLKKGHHQQQQQNSQQKLITKGGEDETSEAVAPKDDGFCSYLGIFACNSCDSCSHCCRCNSCSSYVSYPSCTPCVSRASSFSCFSCASCKTCCGTH